VRHAELVTAGRGVSAAIAKPDRGAVGNAAVVDLGEETLVVDTHTSPAAARELRAAGEEVMGRPVSQVLNTHWHADHVLGNREFPDATIGSTARTGELMATIGVQRLQAQKQAFETKLGAELDRMHAAGDEEGATLLEEHARELPTVTHRFPDETFEERRDYGPAEAITFGGGHTGSDAFLLVRDAGVVVAGDLVVAGMQPWAGHGDPAEWAAILKRLLDLDWETCVPGHGPVSGREVVEPLRDYLLALDEAVRSSEPDPVLPARFEDWGQRGMWARNVAALRER
jgi:glyoxylase-like metal-dependent hydrolase (beta-lactamase superfamily II)